MTDTPTPIEKGRMLAASRVLAANWGREQLAHFLGLLDEHLFRLAEHADNNDDQSRYFQARSELRLNSAAMTEAFARHLHDAFEHYKHAQPTAREFTVEQTQEPLSLVDHDQLDERLAVSTMSRKAGTEFAELLYLLNQRLSALQGGPRVSDLNNPVAPGVFAEGIQDAIAPLRLDTRSKLVIYKLFDSSVMRQLGRLYQQFNSLLEHSGLLPNLGLEVVKDADVSVDVLPGQGSESSHEHQLELFMAIQKLQMQMRARQPAPPPTAQPVSVAALIQRLQQLQRSIGIRLLDMATPQAVTNTDLQPLREKMQQAVTRADPVDADVVEIVGLLFEYMLNDSQLPDSVKALLSYLHTPFLKIALQDKAFFNIPQHPARQLLNSLVAAGERWVEPHGKHRNEVFQQIKAVVEKVLQEFNNDVRIFSELALDFNNYLRQHARRIRLAEKRAMQAAQGEDRLKDVRQRIDAFLQRKTTGIALSPAIRTLLHEPWANFLAFNLLRFGSDSEQWARAAAVVDDVIWYLRGQGQSLGETLPAVLREGFETVGYDSAQSERLLTALQDEHRSALLRGVQAAEAQPSPSAARIEDIDLRQQVVSAVSGDSLLQQLCDAAPGTWFVFNAEQPRSEQQRVKLAWLNRDTLQFMFVNRLGQQVALKTGSELATDIRQGRTRMLSVLADKPFFEQALENALSQIAQR